MQKQFQECDVLIIGSGIAGASAGYFLLKDNPSSRVVMLETESVSSFHTTGRSAAFLLPYYGGDKVVPLTKFSRAFYENPPEHFTATNLLSHRGALHIAKHEQFEHLQSYYDAAVNQIHGLEMISKDAVCDMVPIINKNYVAGGIYDPGCYDLDVSAIHSGFMRGFQSSGGKLHVNAEVFEITPDKDGWLVSSKQGVFKTKALVNAAGAWGDHVANMAGVAPLGLTPLRRTIVVCPIEPQVDKHWPLVIDVDEGFYFRPEGQNILASPGDETPSEPCDCQPEEIDVAKTAHDIELVMGSKIAKVESKWAGLRTFTPDRVPAIGYDPQHKGFFWCVGQGGFGIQTAAAIGQLSADLILERPMNDGLQKLSVAADGFAPDRFRCL